MARAESMQGTAGRAKEAGTQALETVDRLASGPMRVGERAPSKLYVGAVAGSILASLGLMLAGRTGTGIFVGLWAPTILNLALFNKLLEPSRESLTEAAREKTGYGGSQAADGGYATGGTAAGSTYGTTGGGTTGR